MTEHHLQQVGAIGDSRYLDQTSDAAASGASAPGSASATVGHDALVERYIQVKGLTADYVQAKGKRRMLEEAVQFVQVMVLMDLRPPWLTDATASDVSSPGSASAAMEDALPSHAAE